MWFNLASPIKLERLQTFALRYQELTNSLLYYDSETMTAIDAAEAELLKQAFLKNDRAHAEEQIKLRYARERTRIISEVLSKHPHMHKIRDELVSLMRNNPYEMQELGLTYKPSLPIAAVIYSNYYFIKERLPEITARLQNYK